MSSSLAGTEQLTASQIRSNRQELSSESTSENKLEPVHNIKLSLQFQEQSTEVDQVQMTSQSSSNKQELSSEATLENKLELVTNLKAFNFREKVRKLIKHRQHPKLVALSRSSAPRLHPTQMIIRLYYRIKRHLIQKGPRIK